MPWRGIASLPGDHWRFRVVAVLRLAGAVLVLGPAGVIHTQSPAGSCNSEYVHGRRGQGGVRESSFMAEWLLSASPVARGP